MKVFIISVYDVIPPQRKQSTQYELWFAHILPGSEERIVWYCFIGYVKLSLAEIRMKQ